MKCIKYTWKGEGDKEFMRFVNLRWTVSIAEFGLHEIGCNYIQAQLWRSSFSNFITVLNLLNFILKALKFIKFMF